MSDKEKNCWEAFMKTGRINDYLAYKGHGNVADGTPDMQTGYTGRATDGGKAQRFDNTPE